MAAEGDLEKWIEEKGGKAEFFDEAIEIMFGVLRGLEHLHQNDIVHRDIKPANIFLKDKTPLLADFGLARGLDLKQSSILGGTLAYMSPELIAVYLSLKVGSKLNYERTELDDLWAVAVTFQQMLTGEMPFESIDAIRICQPNPLSIKVSAKIEDFLKTAFAKNSSERFQTAKEMRDALAKVIKISEKETIIDEDFDKPKLPEIPVTQDWQEIEAEKARQRKLAEANRLKEAEEARRLKEIELQRQQAEKERLEREKKEKEHRERNKKQRRTKIRRILLGIGAVILSPFIIALLWTKPWETNNQPIANKSVNQSANNAANNASNTASNQPANISANKLANTVSTTSSNPQNFKNSIGMEFVKIPAGSFMMGSSTTEKDRDDDESPQHKVTINYEFYLGKYEVTQAEWKTAMDNNPSTFQGNRLPVENVGWNDAKEFIRKLNEKNDGYEYRLPSEAEWEYACRAGTTTVFSLGNSLSSNQANFGGYYPNGKASVILVKVGSYKPNSWGLYDMHGNVWEWVEDIPSASYDNLPIDGSANLNIGSSSEKVGRGGSWRNTSEYLRCANRGRSSLSNSSVSYGFRVVARVR